MVASARAAHLARRAADYGVIAGPVAVDMARVRQRKQAIVESFRGGDVRRLESNGVDLLMGEANFTGPKSLEVGLNGGEKRRLTAETIVINSGGRPAIPSVEGLPAGRVLNSTTIMELDQAPEHLLVLGGSYVGLEFGQMFCRFGSQVTIIERGPRLVSQEDPDIADAIAEILREDGIELVFDAQVMRAEPDTGDREFQLVVQTLAGERALAGSYLLAAAGRIPNTESPQSRRRGSRARQPWKRARQRSPGNERGRHLRDWRRDRRPCLHPHLVRRFPHSSNEPAGEWEREQTGPPRTVHAIHRPSAGPGRVERGGGSAAGDEHPRREDSHELRGARDRGGRGARHDEGGGGRRERGDSGMRGVGDRGRS